MTQLFHAAICAQCGGSLDLKTLKCEFCSVQHLLDFSKSIPSIASDISDKEYFVGRDRRVDSVLLLMLQQAATNSGVEVALALSDRNYISQIHIHAKLPHNSQWLEVGTIFVDNKRYLVTSHGSNSICQTYRDISFNLQTDLTGKPGGRFYKFNDKLFRGENELLGCKGLKKIFSLMMINALQSNQDLIDAEKRARVEPAKTPSLLEKLFGV